MKLRLVDRPTFEPVKIGDTTFRVRVMSYGDSVELRRKCTVNGRVDEEKLEDEEWAFMLGGERAAGAPGWEGLADASGADFPFDPAQASFVGRSLTLDVATVLKRKSTAFVAKAGDDLGNSPPSSGSAPGETKTPSARSTDGQA